MGLTYIYTLFVIKSKSADHAASLSSSMFPSLPVPLPGLAPAMSGTGLGYGSLYVGVFCPVDVLEQREGAREIEKSD